VLKDDSLPDDELILRRIPNQTYFLGNLTNPRINHHNFELEEDEDGVSCNRESLMSVEMLLNRPEAIPGSRAARAITSKIRALGLDIIDVPDVIDPTNVGHCEIRPRHRNDLENKELRKQLASIFVLIDQHTIS